MMIISTVRLLRKKILIYFSERIAKFQKSIAIVRTNEYNISVRKNMRF